MQKKLVRSLLVFLVLGLVLGLTLTSAAEITPDKLPTLKLTVEKSLLAIYPPIMIYTAQLSYVPPITTTRLMADFYHIVSGPIPQPLPSDFEASETLVAKLEYLGSAPVDSTGKAVLSRQINPGKYVAVARVVIKPYVIWSNLVPYIVR